MYPQENCLSAEAGFNLAKKITARFSRTFYFASLFLDKEKRRAAYSIYAICRISDESVDDANFMKQTSLERVKERVSAAYSEEELNDGLLLAFRETAKNYSIPKEYFDTLIEGMRMDLQINRYGDFKELSNYCYKAAGIIGLIMVRILGPEESRIGPYAVALGIAMQLTNILRDIKEDLLRNRVYLPQDEMKRFGVTERQLSLGEVDDNFRELMRFQIKRARQYYDTCAQGIGLIKGIKERRTVNAMKNGYTGILAAIEKNGYDVFSKRARISAADKAALALKIILGKD